MTTSGKSPAKQRDASPVKAQNKLPTSPRKINSIRRHEKSSSVKNDAQPMDIEEKEIKSELIDAATKNIITPQKNKKKEIPTSKKTVTVTSESIVPYLAALQEEEISSLTDQHLRSLVEMWYRKNHKDQNILKNWTRDLFLIEIDDIIEDAQSVLRGGKIKERVEKHVTELNGKIAQMLKKSFKKVEDFDSYTREELNFYYQDYSKLVTKKPVELSDIKSWTITEMKQELSAIIRKSTDRSTSPSKRTKRAVAKNSKTSPKSNSKSKPVATKLINQPKNTSPESNTPNLNIEHKSNPIEPNEPTTTNIHQDILDESNDELVELYCSLRTKAGFPQNSKTIHDTWSEEMLRKAIKTMQSQMQSDHSQKSTLKSQTNKANQPKWENTQHMQIHSQLRTTKRKERSIRTSSLPIRHLS